MANLSVEGKRRIKLNLWLGLFIPIILIVGISLLYFYLLLKPPVADLRLMTLLLSTTAIISTLIGYTTRRLGWLEHVPTLAWSLLAGYLISGLITFFNVWVSAQLMFTDQHDLLLATVLLLFATAIATTIGYFFTSTLAERVSRLQQAASTIAKGDLSTRVNIKGRDELADLGKSFNNMAEQLHKAQVNQQEVDKLRRDLIAWVSHDLQTPLTSIRAMVEALIDGVVEDKTTSARYLQTIQREVNELPALIDDLSQMARMDASGLTLEINNDSLIDLISDTVESMHELAIQRGVELGGTITQDIDPIPMDARRIGRVLNNLISNALRHTPRGGKVHITAVKQAGYVVVSVSDTGTGISKEDLPYVFDRFYRGEKSRSRLTGGAGLGLAITKGIVTAHKGLIGVESSPEQGALFWFSLPVQPD